MAFADALRAGPNADPATVGWAITALFYAAVHAVRAYVLEHHGIRVVSHEDVRRLRHRFPELRKTESKYAHLKQQSEAARYYLSDHFTWADFDELRRDAEMVLKTWLPLLKSAKAAKAASAAPSSFIPVAAPPARPVPVVTQHVKPGGQQPLPNVEKPGGGGRDPDRQS